MTDRVAADIIHPDALGSRNDHAEASGKILFVVGHGSEYAYNSTVREWVRMFPELHRNSAIFNFHKAFEDHGASGLQRELLAVIETEAPSVIFFPDVALASEFDLEFLASLRSRCFTTVYFGDLSIYFEDLFRYQAQAFDLVLVDEPCEEYRMKLLGMDAAFVPYTYSKDVYRRLGLAKDIDVSFVGRTDRIGRRELIAALQTAGFKLELFGVGTPGGPLSQEKMVEVFNRSRINLNFTGIADYRFTPWTRRIESRLKSVKGRCQEVCLTGSFILSETAPEIDRVFTVGSEIDTFRDAKELVEKVSYYLKHDQEREVIAARGYERASRDYDAAGSWKKVFEMLCARARAQGYKPEARLVSDPQFDAVRGLSMATYLGRFLRAGRFSLAREEFLRLLRLEKRLPLPTAKALVKGFLGRRFVG